MNKEIVLLQKNDTSSAVIVLNDEYKSLGKTIVMKASVSDKFLYGRPFGSPPFADEIKKSREEVTYLVITDIDKVSASKQERFVGLVKDREFHGFRLPSNCIVVFTVEKASDLKSIISQLYRLCVVAF